VVLKLSRKYNVRIIRLGSVRLSLKTELDRVYNSEITAQDKLVEKRKKRSQTRADHTREALNFAHKFQSYGFKDTASIEKLYEAAVEKDQNLKSLMVKREKTSEEKRAELRDQILLLQSKYKSMPET